MVAVAALTAPHAVAPVAPVLSLANPPARRADDYVSLVRKVAHGMVRRMPTHVDVADLISAGTIGLMDALAKYDPSRNDNFEAYAELRIRGAIFDELRHLDWVPRSVRTKSRSLNETTRALETELGRPAALEEIAAAMNLSIEALHELRDDATARGMSSLDDLMSTVGEAHLGAAVQDDEDTLGRLCQHETTVALARAVETLPERERQIIALYYLEGLKQKEIGALLGVTESRVCQLMKRAQKALAVAVAGIDGE